MIYLFEQMEMADNTGTLYIRDDKCELLAVTQDVINKNLLSALEDGKKTQDLVYTQGFRVIGKTRALIKFAKHYGYYVLCPFSVSCIKNKREEFKYDKIITLSDILANVGEIKDTLDNFGKIDVVIDEGFNINKLKEDNFINIITGYTNIPIVEKIESSPIHSLQFQKNIKSTLQNEILNLTDKIKKARENNDVGTYKNLIIAYGEILKLLAGYTS